MSVVATVRSNDLPPLKFGDPTEARQSLDRKIERRAILFLTAAFIFQPILHPTGPGNSSPVDILIIASVITFAIWVRRKPRKLCAPYFLAVALIVGAGAASGIVSQFPGTALQAVTVDVLLFAWCTTVANMVGTPKTMHCVLTAWAISGVFWALVVMFAWIGHITPLEGLQATEGNRVLFTFGDPNYASTYWVATIFVVYAVRKPSARWLRFFSYVALLWALALTESNGGILSLAIGVTFLVLVKSYRRHKWVGVVRTALVISVAIGAFFAAFPLSTLRHDALYSGQPLLVNSLGRSNQSTSERGELVHELGQLYDQTSGVLGIGPGATKPLLSSQLSQYPNQAHDDFLAALVERGPIGLLGLLLLIGSAMLWAGPILRNRLSPRFIEVVPASVGLVAALIALGVNSFYEEIFHFRFLWSLLAIIAVLGKDAKSRVHDGLPSLRG